MSGAAHIDPEIGFNIVEIGPVYDVAIEERRIARVTMTTTARGWPATNYLEDGAGGAAQSVAGVELADVGFASDAPWTSTMMGRAARDYLGVA